MITRLAPALVIATMVVLSSTAQPAVAQDDPPAVDLPDQVVIFVIDLSGSMNEPFDDERSKLDVAKEAFVEAFTNVSPSAFVGLRVYGDQLTATSPASREQNCTEDSRLVAPINQVDRDRLIEEMLGFDALGDTPIGLALRQADTDIPDGTLGTVVLFSDGRDECFDADLDGDPTVGPSWGEDPCEVAREIGGDGVDLRIDRVETVGFRADAAAELELRCIADATGGSYTPIETPEDARDLLPEVLADISSPREAERLGGSPIEGTPQQAGAPELPLLDTAGAGEGRYVDTIEMNTEKWYHVPEYGPGGGTFTATAFGLPAQPGIDFGMRLYLPETDQTFFDNRANDDAGLPRRPTVSIRCPGCSVTGGPNEVFWIVSLSTDNPALGGTYDLELLTEGPAFGGLSTSCEEPQECWYQQEILDRTETIPELEAEYEELLASTLPDELIDQREDLSVSVADAEAAAADASAQQQDLEAQAEALGGESSSYVLLLILAGAGVGLMVITLIMRTRSSSAVAGTGAETADETAVIGRISTTETAEVAEPPTHEAPVEEPGEVESVVPAIGIDEEPTVLPDDPPPAEPPEADRPGDEPADPAPAGSPSGDVLEVPEPGWFTDPYDSTRLRWWDGERWTDETHGEGDGR